MLNGQYEGIGKVTPNDQEDEMSDDLNLQSLILIWMLMVMICVMTTSQGMWNLFKQTGRHWCPQP